MKIVWLALFLSLVIIDSNAQLIHSFGLKGGIIKAKQDWTLNVSYVHINSTARQGYDIGFFVEWFDFSNFNLLTEIHYTQKGTTGTLDESEIYSPPNQFPILARIDYLTIPLLAKFKYQFDFFEIYCLIGPRFDIKIGIGNEQKNVSVVPLESLKKTDLGSTFGLGCELIKILPVKLGLEWRYCPNYLNISTIERTNVINKSSEILLVIGL